MVLVLQAKVTRLFRRPTTKAAARIESIKTKMRSIIFFDAVCGETEWVFINKWAVYWDIPLTKQCAQAPRTSHGPGQLSLLRGRKTKNPTNPSTTRSRSQEKNTHGVPLISFAVFSCSASRSIDLRTSTTCWAFASAVLVASFAISSLNLDGVISSNPAINSCQIKNSPVLAARLRNPCMIDAKGKKKGLWVAQQLQASPSNKKPATQPTVSETHGRATHNPSGSCGRLNEWLQQRKRECSKARWRRSTEVSGCGGEEAGFGHATKQAAPKNPTNPPTNALLWLTVMIC